MIKVHVPATSANCCVGFDCMGMALDWNSTFEFMHSEKLEIEGCPEEYRNEDNLVVAAFRKTCDALGKEMPPFRLKIDSSIPFSRGLGSSATCIVAGLMGANAWFDSPLTKEDLLVLAIKMEGHPDNVAPALFGGICVSMMQEEKVWCRSLHAGDWHGLVIIPDEEVATREARKVLPETISFHEAKTQVAHAMLMEIALCRSDEELLAACSRDYLHEPYRAKLISSYGMVRELCEKHDLPLWISGSGSTMIVLSTDQKELYELKKELSFLNTRMVKTARKGAEVLYE